MTKISIDYFIRTEKELSIKIPVFSPICNLEKKMKQVIHETFKLIIGYLLFILQQKIVFYLFRGLFYVLFKKLNYYNSSHERQSFVDDCNQ